MRRKPKNKNHLGRVRDGMASSVKPGHCVSDEEKSLSRIIRYITDLHDDKFCGMQTE